MATVVNLPQLGETMDEGTVVDCKVKVGDEVRRGDILFDIETDKATLEMESPADGFVKLIVCETGKAYRVGEPLLVLGGRDEQVTAPPSGKSASAAAPAATAATTSAASPPPAPQASGPQAAEKVIASPRAKKLAAELGVDLSMVKGSGPAGRITEEDVQAAAKGGKPAAAAVAVAPGEVKLGQTVAASRLQKITAQRMLKSKQEIPCFYLTAKADVTNLVTYRTKFNETSEVKVAYNDFIIKAVAIGLEKFPIMAGQLDGENIRIASSIGIGLAISVPDGLVAPIVKEVNKKSVVEIAKYSQALVERARGNKLAPEDIEGGCITVSNLGAFGVDSFIPIVVPGQCSILGIGRITSTCVPSDGNIMTRMLMNMTLSVDHKVANGAYAAQFLDFVRKLLDDPATLC